MNRILILLSIIVLSTLNANAQLRYGFKTGLNFARFDGPSETSAAGNSLENWENTTGFHIGMTLGYKFTDHFGVRGEFLYSKRGARYTFEGPSFRLFTYEGGSTFATGNSKYQIRVNNTYFDLPVVAYTRWGDFEISGGVYGGVLVQSIGEGSLTFENGVTTSGYPLEKTQFNLQHNYRRDDPGGFAGSETFIININPNKKIELPKTIGAYYDYKTDQGSLYNSLDYGVVGGVTYYLSAALYAHVRLQYGLADITRNEADAAKGVSETGGALIFRNDKDRNFLIQASVGFSF